MAVNELTFEQSSVFLTELYKQATGNSDIASVDTGNFVSVAQSVLKTGYDNVINSISQVLSRTIFSVRPYSSKLEGMMVSEEKYGAITRKINFIDGTIENDDRLTLEDGTSVDQWKVNKPKVLQTNFYGFTQYQKHITIFKDQLDSAFSSATQFGSFIGGLLQNVYDQLTQVSETEARATLINFMLGKYKGDSENTINVAQLFYDETGVEITVNDLNGGEKIERFTKWLYSYINTTVDKMSERTEKYHINITGKELKRHTQEKYLKAYMISAIKNSVNANVLSSIFNPDRLKTLKFNYLNFWQSINHPYDIKGKPTYLLTNGNLKTESEEVTLNGIIGIMYDVEALGMTRASCWTQATPMNAMGGYYNIFYHFTHRMWNDFTENGIVLYIGTVEKN